MEAEIVTFIDAAKAPASREQRARRRRRLRWRRVGLGAVAVVVGLAFAVFGMTGLRAAHLERQRTLEGLAWMGPTLWFTAAWLLVVFGAVTTLVAAAGLPRQARRRVWAADAVAAVLLVAASAVAVWVASHGHDCIGPCG